MANTIVSMIPDHKSYLEPFFGSGAILFTKQPSMMETINDIDDEVVNLFRVIRNHPEELKRIIYLTPYARVEYDNAFQVETEDPIERARLFLVKSLQSHGFSMTDKIGWKNDIQGREKAYSVKHFNEVPDIIDSMLLRLKQVQIEHQDAVELIKKFNSSNVFIYLDPPYLLNTRTRRQYKHEMTDNEHVRLLETILESKAKIMISGYQSEMYDEYLKKWNHVTYEASAAHGLQRKEQIWYNYEGNQLTIDQYLIS